MADAKWRDEAITLAAQVIRNSADDRGVMKSPDKDIFAIFAPRAELQRIRAELTAAGIEELGKGHSNEPGGRSIFAMFVRATDETTLLSIVAER